MRNLLSPSAILAVFALIGPAAADDSLIRIVLTGDSYLSGYGLDDNDTFGARLDSALKLENPLIHVVDTGYTETSLDAVGRLESFMSTASVLAAPSHRAVILELGSNDCGPFKLAETRTNLVALLAPFAAANVPVLIVGTNPYHHCERAARPNYAAEYMRMFADLATQYGDLYYPDFKIAVSGHPDLLQPDHDHPNAQGEALIVTKMLPIVRLLVAQAERSNGKISD